MNILIVAPSFKILGGVANHYLGLHDHWRFKINYIFQGKRKKIPAYFTLVPDYFNFIFKLIFYKFDCIIINPSLRKYQLKRDSIYLRIARFFKKPVITFIHGWDDDVANQFINKPSWFVKNFGKSAFIYCLYSKFRDELLRMGIKCPVLLTTTKVSDKLIENFDINKRIGKVNNLLFLARLEANKGIFITLDIFKNLKEKYPNLTLTICGSGSAEISAKEYVKNNSLQNVYFKGKVSGNKLIKVFEEADVYILPTSHGEGMATSVLEAMAFGLPVVTRPIGGINDFFKNGIMGELVESLDPKEFEKIILNLINNPEKTKMISHFNYEYARSRFMASKVVKQFETDIINHSKDY